MFLSFALAIAGISFLLFYIYKDASENVRESAKVNSNIELIASIQKYLFDVQNIETCSRGYLITGDKEYFDEYLSGLQQNETDFSNIENKLKNEPSSKNFLDSLRVLTKRKIKFTEKLILLTKEGKSKEAVTLVNSNEGKIAMKNIRELTSRMEKQLRNDLDISAAKKEKAASDTRSNFLLLSIFIFFALLMFYLIIVSDIRKSERVKSELNLVNLRIKDLYDNAPSGYLSVDKDLKVIKANQTVANWLGYRLDEIENSKNLIQLVPPKHLKTLNKLFHYEKVSNVEIEISGRKSIRDVMLNSVTIRNKQGGIEEKRIVLIDISERKKTEEENRYLARLIDQTSDAIYSLDKSLNIKSWNKGAEKMYGYTAEEIMSKGVALIGSSLTPEERESVISELNETGQWSAELVHQRKDGTHINVLTSATAVRDDNDEVTSYVLVVQDITSRILYESKLLNFNNELIEKVNLKTKEIINILERLTDGFISIDKDYEITYINSVAAKIFGRSREELLGKNLTKAFDQEENSIRKAYKKSFETQTRIEVEEYYKFLNKWFYGVMYPSPEGVSIFFRDVTQRKESEKKLIESEKQYKHLFENNPLPMFVLNLTTIEIRDVNKTAVSLYGYSYDEFIGKKMSELFDDSEIERFEECCKSSEGKMENAGKWIHKTKDKKTIIVELLTYDIKYGDEPNLLVISNDVTDKIRYEEELKTSRDQLRQLSVHAEKVREEERAHIAREIHDELGQQLTGLKMDLSWVAKKMDSNVTGTKEKITEMVSLVDETVKSIRKIASELRPGMLDDLGLNAAIDWQIHEFQKRSGIECTYHTNLKDQKFEKNISIGIFRILQEALTNVARHSKATRVNCDLITENETLQLTVADNGSGMITKNNSEKTLGLLGMKERALMMNGELTIESKTGNGTTIHVIVPLTGELS